MGKSSYWIRSVLDQITVDELNDKLWEIRISLFARTPQTEKGARASAAEVRETVRRLRRTIEAIENPPSPRGQEVKSSFKIIGDVPKELTKGAR